jgi:hypothetical protein
MKKVTVLLAMVALTFASCSKTFMKSDMEKAHRGHMKSNADLKSIDVYYDAGECTKKYEVIAIYQAAHLDIPILAPRSTFFKNSLSYKAAKKAKELKGDAVIIRDYFLVSIIKYVK